MWISSLHLESGLSSLVVIMFLLILLLLFSFVLVFVLKIASVLISESVVLRREELTSYECGFEHHGLSRVPFSMRYFYLTLIFLLFDLEIILLLFFPFSFIFSFSLLSFTLVVFFIIFLYLGLIYEWKDGRLEWVI